MRALSIQQPWAWLIVNGYKDVENRSWPTSRRGPIYVHAGKKIDKDGYEWIQMMFPQIPLPDPKELETGGLVGTVSIVNCVKQLQSKWFSGPYGFVLELGKPIKFRPYLGKLSFFHVDAESQP
jgi:hypothetical protein